MAVYAIQMSRGGPCKIGYAQDPIKRMRVMQHSCPYSLEIVAEFQGGSWLEERMHELLKPMRLHGEWFDATLDQIREAAAKAMDPEEVIAPSKSLVCPEMDEIFAAGGGRTHLAAALGVHADSLVLWRSAGIPIRLMDRVSRLTGVTKAKVRDVSRIARERSRQRRERGLDFRRASVRRKGEQADWLEASDGAAA